MIFSIFFCVTSVIEQIINFEFYLVQLNEKKLLIFYSVSVVYMYIIQLYYKLTY